jgi:cytochrome c oxidase assembly protein subunit 15
MHNAWLHRYTVVVAFCTLLLVVAGGLVTSNDAGLSVPDWPLSYGKLMPKMEGGIFFEHGHRMVATTVGLLTIILAIWLWRADPRRWMRRLGWIALAAVIAQGLLGGMTVIFLLPKPVSISHACLAQLFFSTTVLIALFTSAEWARELTMAEDSGAPSLHALAIAVSLCVLAQLALGAAARHGALGVLPHVAGASVVTGMILWIVIRVLVRHSEHAPLRRSALVLLAISISQVFLGIAAYMSRIATIDAVQPMAVMVGFTVAHVAVGALTRAASVVMAVEVFRHVRRPEIELAPGRVTVTS